MDRDELEHAIRAACDAFGVDTVYVLGSQSILGAHPNAPEPLLRSVEVDIVPAGGDEEIDAEALHLSHGEGSRFYELYGFWIHGMSLEGVVLPPGWMDRTITVRNAGTSGYTGQCLEPHDLAVSKLAAFRYKDRRFLRALLRYGLIEPRPVRRRLDAVDLAEDERRRLRTWVGRTADDLS